VGTADYKGVCHVALAEEGHTRPGEVLFGTDSHTCTAGAFGLFATGIGNTDAAFVMGTGKLWLRVPATLRVAYEGDIPAYLTAKDMILALIGSIGVDGATYASLEFVGSATESMDMAERMTLCNMAIECGAKSGIVPPDDTTIEFVKARTQRPFEAVVSDGDATYLERHRFDVSAMAPKVAKPHSPDNVVDVMELKDTPVNRCYIGSCTGGKTEDFVRAAEILDGKKVAVDTFCVPATNLVDRDFDTIRRNGRTLREIFEAAGTKIGPPSCAACLGGPIDTFGRTHAAEVVISTTNRNFPGRMGSKDSAVYLASPYTVAASALTGRITDPRNYL
jgi:3-isopropylmalate/(R)-2-methylmalate dehydratase large subunit